MNAHKCKLKRQITHFKESAIFHIGRLLDMFVVLYF
jgi:hypothetical protein